MADIHQQLAKRLRRELERKGLDAARAAQSAGLDEGILEQYLGGERVISFDELRPLCDALSADLMLLLAGARRPEVRLAYRSIGSRDRDIVSRAEGAFVLTADLLPEVDPPRVHRLDFTHREQYALISEVLAVIDNLKEQFATLQHLYESMDLPVLTVHAGEEAFDACCFNAGKRSLIYVNLDKPNVRLHFSLLHEVWHCLFDRDEDIPVDVLPSELYMPTIQPGAMSEFLANKLAQFWLVPFAEAQALLLRYPAFEGVWDLLDQQQTSPQVIANALCDVQKYQRLRRNGRQVSAAEIRQAVQDQIASDPQREYSGDPAVRTFANERARWTRSLIEAGRDQFGDEVWEAKIQPVLEGST